MTLVGASRRHRLSRRQWVGRSVSECFAFFSDARNLERITPRWLDFRIVHMESSEIREGSCIEYRIRWLGFSLRWKTRILRFEPPRVFVDEQEEGPYRLWVHTHRFEEEDGGTRMEDEVDYVLPFGLLGVLSHAVLVRRQLEAIFDYRAARIAQLLQPETRRKS